MHPTGGLFTILALLSRRANCVTDFATMPETDRQTNQPTNRPRERERDDFNILRKGCADKRRAHSTYWVCTNAKDECFCAVFVCENCFYSSTSPSLYSFTRTEYVSQPEVKAQLWLRSVLTHIAQRAQFLSSETFVCCTSKIIYICNSLLGLHILHHKFTAASDSEQAMNGGGSWQLQLHAQAATQNNIYIFAFSDTKYEIFERFFFVGLFCFSACQKRFAWLRFCDCGISHVQFLIFFFSAFFPIHSGIVMCACCNGCNFSSATSFARNDLVSSRTGALPGRRIMQCAMPTGHKYTEHKTTTKHQHSNKQKKRSNS